MNKTVRFAEPKHKTAYIGVYDVKKGEGMAYICSAGLGIPENRMTQEQAKNIVKEVLPMFNHQLKKLMPVFDNANIHERQMVVSEDWLKKEHTFSERNDLYSHLALKYALEAIDHCLSNDHFLKDTIPYESIDMVMYVSSTGMSTPSLDAYILNERPFHERVNRMPLWGLGCAGGAIGLSRAYDYLKAHPSKSVLVICAELCSLTFQKNDLKMSNLIGTALFGDGVAAILLCGEESPFLSLCKVTIPKITKTDSFTLKKSTSIMGWNITNRGFEVVFSKEIPNLVNTLWKDHVNTFLGNENLREQEIHSFIAHPGGKKVLEAMEDSLAIPKYKLAKSYEVLHDHGNMSSATVFYVLKRWLKENITKNEKSLLCALGPGFSSELLLLEWG